MKRTVAAVIILLLLLIGSTLHIHNFHRITETVSADISNAITLCKQENRIEAARALSAALAHWRAHERYTQIFLNHESITDVNECFFNMQSCIMDNDFSQAALAGNQLSEKLSRLYTQETWRIENIL